MADRARADRGSRGDRAAAATEPDTLAALSRQQPAAPVAAAPAPTKGIRVRAKELGVYMSDRKRKDEEFILAPGDKPAKWMEVVGEAK